MAGNIKGITIEFKGDTTQLGKALGSVNKQIRETDNALKEVDKALKLDPTNTELLAQKEQLLAKQVEQVAEKLDIQKQAAESAAEALQEGTITQEEYAKLSAQVATTADKLDELESSASGAAGELEETGDAAQDAGDKATSAKEKFQVWGDAISNAASIAYSAISAVADVIEETATALADMTVQTADYADNILTLSQVSGVSTDTLQALTYAEDLLDVSASQVAGSITKLIKTMSNAEGDAASYASMVEELNTQLEAGEITAEEYAEAVQGSGSAFDQLGISILDNNGELRDAEEVFWEVIDALGEIDNETERDAVAMNLLGRSARDLNPLIEAGSGAFRQFAAEAEDAGAIMSDDALRDFQHFDDNLSRWGQGVNAAKRALGSVLLPVLDQLATDGVDLINDFTNGILDANGDIDAMSEVIDTAVENIVEILNGDLVSNIIELGSSIIQTLASAVLSNMDSILQAGFDLLMTLLQGIVDNLASLAPVASNMIVTLVNFVINNLPTVIDAAIQIIVAIVDGIARALPELIPAAVACIEQIIEALIDNLDLLIPAALELVMAIALGIVAAIPDLVAVVPQLIDAIQNEMVELSSSLADAALTWGADLIDGFVDGFFSGFGRLEDACAQLGNTVYDYLHHSTPEKGPLANDDEWGSDFVENFINGMDSEQAALERSLYQTANVIYTGMTSPDYTSALNGISTRLAGIGGGTPQVINVWLGNERVGTVVANANAMNAYRDGGL